MSFHFVLNIFPFPGIGPKLIGDLWIRGKEADRFPRFACFFVFLTLLQYYWRSDSTSAYRQSEANKIKSAKFFIGAASSLCFANKRRVQLSANNICCGFYIAQILLVLRPVYRCTFFYTRTRLNYNAVKYIKLKMKGYYNKK